MKLLVQWATVAPGDWEEVDSAAFARAPRKPLPTAAHAVDAARGWINALNVQGVEFIGYDHYAVEPLPSNGCRVTVWKDDPEDLASDSLGEFYARVVTFLPLAPDARLGGAWNTRQSQVVYAGPKLAQFYEDNPTEDLTVRPWAEFVAPPAAVTRHGVWMPEASMQASYAAKRACDWREWTEGVPAAQVASSGLLKLQRPQGLYDKPKGTKTFGLRDTAEANLVHLADHETAMTRDAFGTTETLASASFSGGESRETFCFSSAATEPDSAAWPTGDYRCQLDITAQGGDISYGLRVAGGAIAHFSRVDDGLGSHLQVKIQTQALFTGTGLKLATTGSVSWAAGATGDRFECLVAATRAASHGNQTITLRCSADSFADGPWSVSVTGTIATTAADATSSASGTITTSGSVAASAADATSSASGTVTASGTIAATAADATGSASGTVSDPVITGTIAASAEDAAANASGAVESSGTIAATAEDAASSASGALTASGTIAATAADATAAASGTVSDPAITGTIAATAEDAASSASGSIESSGTIAATAADATSSASGTVTASGSIAAAAADATAAASGTVSDPAITGTIAATAADAAANASGTVSGGPPVTGTIASVLADATASASGQVGTQQAPNVNDGAWTRLTGEYPKPRRRRKEKLQAAPDFALVTSKPAPQRAPRRAPPLRIVVSGDSPIREKILGELARPAPRGTRRRDPDEDLAIALLLAA